MIRITDSDRGWKIQNDSNDYVIYVNSNFTYGEVVKYIKDAFGLEVE